MAYRRKQGLTKSSTFKDEVSRDSSEDLDEPSQTSPSLAAKAIRASAAHRDSSLSTAYSQSAFRDESKNQGSPTYDYTSMKGSDEVGGFWGVLVRKAKAILEDETMSREFEATPKANQEGRSSTVENKTADKIQETRKPQIRRNGTFPSEQNQGSCVMKQTSNEDQLTESRKMAVATAAKAKLLLRELKTLKSDLAFAKERCSQLEEENRKLRETDQKGDDHDDDDMIRLQLETLLAEKSRLANENAVYARENRFLREILEYHQLAMEFIDCDNDGDIEEVTEVYPSLPAVSKMLSDSPPSPSSPTSPSRSSFMTKDQPQVTMDVPPTEVPPSHTVPEVEDSTKTW